MTRADDERFGAELTQAMSGLRARALQLTRNGSDVSDLVQETLLKAWKSRHRFQAGTNLRAWLMCIMRNAHMSNLRVRGRETPEGLSDYADVLLTPPSQEWEMAARSVRRAIGELRPDHADAIILVGALGASYEEAARRFGCPDGTMKSRVCRARRELRERTGVAEMFVRRSHATA